MLFNSKIKVELKQGRCVNTYCFRIGQMVKTDSKRFVCPSCKMPLQEIVTEKEEIYFPWKIMVFMVGLAVLCLCSVWFYTNYQSKMRNLQIENASQQLLHQEEPNVEDFQKELNIIINPATMELRKNDMIDRMINKYKENILCIHKDSLIEQRQTREPIKKYLQYLKIFTGNNSSLHIEKIQVIKLIDENDSLKIYLLEKINEHQN